MTPEQPNSARPERHPLRRAILAPLLLLMPATPSGAASAADSPAAAQASSPAELQLEAVGLSSDQGQVLFMLYRPGDTLRHPWRKVGAEIQGGRAAAAFAELPFGDYGVIAVHDHNNDGQPNHSLFGFPAEPLAFSAGFRRRFFLSPPPTFERIHFRFTRDNKQQRLSFP